MGARSVRHNGHPTDFLPKAAHEANRASRLLTAAVGRPIDVRGVLAILADDWTVKETAERRACREPARREGLAPAAAQATLSPHEVIEIAAAASKPSTWTTRA